MGASGLTAIRATLGGGGGLTTGGFLNGATRANRLGGLEETPGSSVVSTYG